MKQRLSFYIIVVILVLLDSLLLSSPNLLGKIGLIIYKYHYLRTFPRTLLTVCIVVFTALLLCELVRFLVKQHMIRWVVGIIVLLLMVSVSLGMLIKTAVDFSAWTYSHTGWRFQYGAYLMPVILMTVFTHALVILPRTDTSISSATMDEVSNNNNTTS